MPKKQTVDMTWGKPFPLLVRFAVPLILGSLFQQLYSFADTAIIGRCIGSDALTAVGVTGSLNFLVLGFTMGSAMGFGIPISQAVGAGEPGEVSRNFWNGLYLSVAIGLVISVGVSFFTRPLLALMKTPAQLLDCHNLFKVRTQAAHCCHLEAEDMALLGKRKVSAVCCPDSDRKLAAGESDVLAMVKAGMNVAFGTDSAAVVGSMDLLSQARTAALSAKVRTGDPETLNAQAALLMATVCGARAQGRADRCGMIKVGMDADLVALDFTQPHLIPCHNIVNSVVYAASGRDVCMTMVRGNILYASGKYLTIDLNAVMKELAEHAMETVFTEREEPNA